MSDHERHRDEVGAYLLDALPEPERQAFERHLQDCAACREEVERLRPAADALPRSVEPLAPPPRLKASLMEAVRAEAATAPVPRRTRPSLRERLGGIGSLRPTLAWASASFLLAVGLLTGYGVSELLSGDATRTVAASADRARAPGAAGTLSMAGDGEDGAILRVQGLRDPGRGRVFQAWIERDGVVVPEPTFEVGPGGSGAVAVPEDMRGARAVMVTREPRGGSRKPSESPILTVRL
jgi:hypothetical protein